MKKLGILNTVLIVICICFIIGGVMYLDKRIPKIAHISTSIIYDEFDLKLELEKKLEIVEENRQWILDSLMLNIEQMSAHLQHVKEPKEEDIRKFQMKRQYFLGREEEFLQSNQALAEKYTEQIWKQLNQYIKDYGTENGYTYILGANGSGALMSSTSEQDITDEVKAYVNTRYNGIVNN